MPIDVFQTYQAALKGAQKVAPLPLQPQPTGAQSAWEWAANIGIGLLDVIDNLNRFQYAVTGAITAVYDGKFNSLPDRMWQGFTREKRWSFEHILKDLGMQKGIARSLLALPFDYAVDPLVWVNPFSIAFKGLKAARVKTIKTLIDEGLSIPLKLRKSIDLFKYTGKGGKKLKGILAVERAANLEGLQFVTKRLGGMKKAAPHILQVMNARGTAGMIKDNAQQLLKRLGSDINASKIKPFLDDVVNASQKLAKNEIPFASYMKKVDAFYGQIGKDKLLIPLAETWAQQAALKQRALFSIRVPGTAAQIDVGFKAGEKLFDGVGKLVVSAKHWQPTRAVIGLFKFTTGNDALDKVISPQKQLASARLQGSQLLMESIGKNFTRKYFTGLEKVAPMGDKELSTMVYAMLNAGYTPKTIEYFISIGKSKSKSIISGLPIEALQETARKKFTGKALVKELAKIEKMSKEQIFTPEKIKTLFLNMLTGGDITKPVDWVGFEKYKKVFDTSGLGEEFMLDLSKWAGLYKSAWVGELPLAGSTVNDFMSLLVSGEKFPRGIGLLTDGFMRDVWRHTNKKVRGIGRKMLSKKVSAAAKRIRKGETIFPDEILRLNRELPTDVIKEFLERRGEKVARLGEKVLPEAALFPDAYSKIIDAVESITPGRSKDIRSVISDLQNLILGKESVAGTVTRIITKESKQIGVLGKGSKAITLADIGIRTTKESNEFQILLRGLTKIADTDPARIYLGAVTNIAQRDALKITFDAILNKGIATPMRTRGDLLEAVRKGDTLWEAGSGKFIPKSYDAARLSMRTGKRTGTKIVTMPDDVSSAWRNIEKLFVSPEALDEATSMFFKYFDRIHNTVKGWMLFHPGVLIRNVISNWWSLMLAGVSNPVEFTSITMRAGKLQKWMRNFETARGAKLQKLLQQTIRVKGTDIPMRQFCDDMKFRRILGRGFMGAEIPRKYAPSMTPIVKQTGIAKKVAVGLPAKFRGAWEVAEDNARIALYLHGIEKGLAPADAAKQVMKFLFDYADLTRFEAKGLKRAMMFPTWSRKNVPLILTSMVERPARLSLVEKARQAFWRASDMSVEQLPEWLESSGATPVPGFDKRIAVLRHYLPPYEVEEWFNSPVKAVMDMVSPMWKTLPEIAYNYSIYQRRKIEQYPMETGVFGLPTKAEYAAMTLFRPMREVSLIPRGRVGRFGIKMLGVPTYAVDLEKALRQKNWKLMDEYRELYRMRRYYQRIGNIKKMREIDAALVNLQLPMAEETASIRTPFTLLKEAAKNTRQSPRPFIEQVREYQEGVQ